jgi:hypothetical protein
VIDSSHPPCLFVCGWLVGGMQALRSKMFLDWAAKHADKSLLVSCCMLRTRTLAGHKWIAEATNTCIPI